MMRKMLVVIGMTSVVSLSGCVESLPKCHSSEAKDLIQKIVNEKRYMLGDFVEVDNVEETAFNKESEIRVCSADLTTTKATEAISYSIKWQDKEHNQFWLEIN